MRRGLLVAAGCLVCLSLPGLANSTIIKLSRPDTDYAAFLRDRDACLSAAGHWSWWTASNGAAVGGAGHYDLYKFADCMTAKGYRLDPDGYRAAKYYYLPGQMGYTLRPE